MGHYRPRERGALLLALLIGVGLVWYGAAARGWTVVSPVAEGVVAAASSTSPERAATPLPTELRIPSISLTAPFEGPLALGAEGEPDVPTDYGKVGWYAHGPRPGEVGPAVVLGHVDSFRGPAIFWRLHEVEAGDEVFIDHEDGSTTRFVVTHTEETPSDSFPFASVYGNIDHAGLRLITCAGSYNRQEERYSHHVIVYARRVAS